MSNYTLGLDLGITSIGWALIDPANNRLVDMGVRLFEQANAAADSRKNRSARRNIRRKAWRKKQVKNAFVDFGLLNKEDFENPDFCNFTINNGLIKKPKDQTVQHLRLRALNEKVTTRELFLALYNIAQTRGHFLLETVNFESDSQALTFDLFKEKFYQLADTYVVFSKENKQDFERDVLQPLFENKVPKANDLKKMVRNNGYCGELYVIPLYALLNLLCSRQIDLNEIDSSLVLKDGTAKVDLSKLANADEINDYLQLWVDLHDMVITANLLKDHQYICQLNVEKLDSIYDIYDLKKMDPKSYEEKKKEIQAKMSGVAKHPERLRLIRNMENKFPNGLYVKEAKAILRNQQKYDDRISDEFIEVIASILSARIPYYVGPLSENGTNAWIKKTANFKYSYDYSSISALDVSTTLKTWKKRMISHCTYLPDEYALPKGSFVAETFAILNEINVLSATTKDGDDYYLTLNDKYKLFNELFLKKDVVSYQDVKDCLNLGSFGTKSGKSKRLFNAKYTLYPKIVMAAPELCIQTLDELFDDITKVKRLEETILNINLFEDEVNLKKALIEDLKFDDVTATRLSKLNTTGFYAFSYKFLMETSLNSEGESMMEILLADNIKGITNEQMTIISNAKDADNNSLNLESNKYLQKLVQHPYLDISLLMDKGNPILPISRPVVRTINELFKVYHEIINIYGVPNRVVIETARDLLGDDSKKGKESVNKADSLRNMYDNLLKQVKEAKKKHKTYISFGVADWDDIEKYITDNHRKIELYIQQNGQDLITGLPINLNELDQYEIDHVLPRGFGDNSRNNLMLIHRLTNSKKGDRLPLEFIESDTIYGKDGKHVISSDYIARVNALHEIGLIDDTKLTRLLLPSTDEALDFINRNLVDTHYIIREITSILKAFNQVNGYDTHIVSLKSSFTTVYRSMFRMNKTRDLGDQHHAHDAALVAIADTCMSTIIPHYDQRGNNAYYHLFLEDMKKYLTSKKEDKESGDKLKNTIGFAYYKTFGDRPGQNGSLVNQIKLCIPLMAYKVNKHYQGQMFNATLYPPTSDESNVLSILGVNNKERSYSSVECIAVDFFKFTDKKGNRKHIAIHIPKVIVDPQGNINKEKYIKLIKEHYKCNELLDESGNLKEYLFRVRMFRNDLYYDTEHNQLMLFNIGSIVNKKLEIKHPMVFAYEQVDYLARLYKQQISKQFDINDYKFNKYGENKFNDISIDGIIYSAMEQCLHCSEDSKYYSGAINYLKGYPKERDFYNHLALLSIQLNRKQLVPTIFGQNKPVANSINGDAEYVKVKSTALGVRQFYSQEKLIVSGPNNAENKYSCIRKEKFLWSVSKSMVE